MKNSSLNDMTDLLEIIKCPCCDLFFVDSLRPHLLNCGHQICSECLSLNKAHYSCLICGWEYNKKDLDDTIINYINDEAIHKLSQMNLIDLSTNKTCIPPEKEKFILYCVNCDTLMLNSNVHLKYFPKHNIISIESYYNFVISKLILKKLECFKNKEHIEKIYTNNKLNFSLDFNLFNLLSLVEENKDNIMSDILIKQEEIIYNKLSTKEIDKESK
jgi:hypothetical protein